MTQSYCRSFGTVHNTREDICWPGGFCVSTQVPTPSAKQVPHVHNPSRQHAMHASAGQPRVSDGARSRAGHSSVLPQCWWQGVHQPASSGHAPRKKLSSEAAVHDPQTWVNVCINVPKQAEECSTSLPFPRPWCKAVHQQLKASQAAASAPLCRLQTWVMSVPR